MAILKNTLLFIVLNISYLVLAQENTEFNNAFLESFALEAEAKYSQASDVLEKVYIKDNYEINLRLGWLNYKAESHEKSNTYYSNASQILPYSIEAMLGATLPKSALNKWDEVLEIYKTILSIDTKNTTALYNAGSIYYNRGLFADAFAHFNELHNLYPTDYDAMLMHGWSAFKIGKIREAKVIFRQLLLLYPNDESAKTALSLMN